MSSGRWPSLLRRPSDGLAVEEGYHLHDIGDIGGVFDLLLAAGPVYGNVIPAVDNTYDLGTAVLSWRYLYVHAIYDEAGTLRFDLSGNLTPAGDIIPATDSDLDLGTAALSFDKIYANALYDEAGVQRLDANAWLRMPDGANNTPAYSFTSDPDTGWYLGGDGILTASVAAVAQLSVVDGVLVPATDNDIDLGTSALSFKNLYAHAIYDEAGVLRFDLSGNFTPAGDIIPASDSDLDLGTAALSFDKLYANAIYDEAGVERFDLSLCKGTTFTPTLTAVTTNPTLGATGTATGWYQQIGKLVNGWAKITFGGAGADPGSGLYKIDLPVTASGNIPADTSGGCSIGSGRLYDDSGSDTWLIDAFLASTSNMRLRYDLQTGTGGVSHAAPFTFADADYITIHFSYEAA